MSKEIKEIRGVDERELRVKLHDLRKEQFQLRFRGAAEEMAKTSRYRQIRRSVARILTVLAERQGAQAKGAGGGQ